MKPAVRVWLLLLLVLLLRAVLQGWDSGLLSPHPDERQVAFVGEKLAGPTDDPGFYAYGQLHFTAVRAVAGALGLGRDYRGLLRAGRLLSLFASVAAIALGWLLARLAWGRSAALLAVALAAWVPLDLEQAHFATVEAHHALWVMATLAGCYWLARRGSLPAAVVAGAAWGASLAVKVASLPLAGAMVVALLVVWPRRRWPSGVALALAAAGGALGAFALAQPSAFAGRPPLPSALALLGAAALETAGARLGRWRRAALLATALLVVAGAVVVLPPLAAPYLRGVGEQVAMASGAADLPYTRVYRHTPAVLYPLRQLALWGLGPALLLAAVAGAGSATRRLWRLGWRLPGRAATLLALLLAWLLPTAVRLATLQVKFLRYWQPLVVPAVLVAAWWLARPRRRGWLRWGVLAATALWGVAYLWAFATPHPHVTAARWLDQMVRPGATVAFESWDETLPLAVPVHAVTLPSYDLPDDAVKVDRWCEVLAQADWVVLTSDRVRHTVLANSGRFPATGRLYRMLLSGDAGFAPLTRVDRGPRLLGIVPSLATADESFVNYDFPRVVVLRRVAPVPAAALAARALAPSGPAPRWPVLEHRLVDPLPQLPPRPGAAAQVAATLAWAAVLLVAGGTIWLLLGGRLAGWPDGGFGLCLATGWAAVGWLAWLGDRVGLWPAGPRAVTWVLLLGAAAAGTAAWPRRAAVVRRWRRARTGRRRVVVVVAVVWALFLAARLGNPAVYWGEKPMDLSFLEAFVHAPAWPPGEPWLAGLPLHYYYLGEVLAAVPVLASGARVAVGYNLMAATLPALGAAVLASLGLAVARRRRWWAAWLGPLVALLGGNLAWPFLLGLAHQGRWFDLWWATSRVIPGFAIDEYPLWTALFADLHAHFLAQPVLLAALAWGWVLLAARRRWRSAAAVLGVLGGVLVATNPWDAVAFTTVLAVGVLLARRRAVAAGRMAVAGAAGVLAVAPFWGELAAWLGAGVGGLGVSLNRADFAPAWAVVRHLGVFLLPLVAGAVHLLTAGSLLPLAAAAVAAGAAAATGSGAAAVGLGAGVLFAAAAWRDSSRVRRLGWALGATASVLVAVCERVTLLDRMNTLFKVYNGVWLLLAGALAVLLLRTAGARRRLLLAVWLPLEAIALVNLPLGLAQGWLQPRVASPRPTLDGDAFLAAHDPTSWVLVRALEGVARPGDVVAEAAGPSYQDYTRIAMHTGLRTVVGWQWHLQQRGQDPAEVARRVADLRLLYEGGDPAARRAVLDRYQVRWVVVGALERSTYHLVGSDPLAAVPGLERIVADGDAALYRVRRRWRRE